MRRGQRCGTHRYRAQFEEMPRQRPVERLVCSASLRSEMLTLDVGRDNVHWESIVRRGLFQRAVKVEHRTLKNRS